MLVQSFTTIVEAAISSSSEKRFAGNIHDSRMIMSHENLSKLEQLHSGIFAFIAFHPKADKLVAEYIRLGSLGADSGKHVFALFTLDTHVYKPSHMNTKAFENWLTIDKADYPAYQLVQTLFPSNVPPRLPGILFIQKFSEPTEPVFVSLEEQKKIDDLVITFRKLFEMATKSYLNENSDQFALRFSTALAANNMPYQRGGKTSMREWLIKAFYQVHKNLGDIVSVVSLIK